MSVESYEIRKGKDVKINGTVIGKDTEGVKKVIRKEIIKMWQTRWEISTKNRMMFTFFNSIQERLQAKWVQSNYWSTQILTGHGNFYTKLLQLGLIEKSSCKCGAEEDNHNLPPHLRVFRI